MQLLIDHALAVIVGGIIIFVLAAVNFRAQQGAIQAIQVDATKGGLELVVNMLDQDFGNMGSGMHDANDDPSTSVITFFGSNGAYEELRFRGLSDRTPNAEPSLITYRWRVEGQTTLADNSVVDVYQIERLVDGNLSGGSLANISSFSLTLLNENMNVVTPGNLHLTRFVDVDLSVLSPLGPEGLLEEARWVKQYRPINLDREARDRIRIVLP
jgi:hypothetical protein